MTLDVADYEQIRQLMARFALALDFGRADAYADCYTPDGTIEYFSRSDHVTLTGRDELMTLATNAFAGTQGNIRHWNHSHVFESESTDEVHVTSYMALLRVGEVPQAGVTFTGMIYDILHKINGTWLIHRRVVRADPQPGHDTPPTDHLVIARDKIAAQFARSTEGG
jgi:hypothetical protein